MFNKLFQFFPRNETERRRFPTLRKFIQNPFFGLVVVLLVLFSVLLILLETFLLYDETTFFWIHILTDILLVFFIIELFLRWLVSVSFKQFLREHFIDILALIPMIRIFRLGRVFQLARLLRLFSLGTLLHRRLSIFSNLISGKFIEYMVIVGFMIFSVIFGAVGLAQFEPIGPGTELKNQQDAIWKSLFSLLTGEYASYPQTFGGKLIFACIVMFGMSIFAMLTGTVSAIMIEKLKEGAMGKTSNPEELQNHLVICGFSSKVGIIIEEFSCDKKFSDCDILLISEQANIQVLKDEGIKTDKVTVLQEDFTHMETLKRGGISRAQIAIILSEASKGRTTHDIDARTILAALTIEKINKKVHTSAEIYHEEYADHLKMGGVNDVVVQGQISGSLLARVAMNQGLLPFFKDVLSNKKGNSLNFISVPPEFIDKDFKDVVIPIYSSLNSLVVGIKPKSGELSINPKTYKLSKDDELLAICPLS